MGTHHTPAAPASTCFHFGLHHGAWTAHGAMEATWSLSWLRQILSGGGARTRSSVRPVGIPSAISPHRQTGEYAL
jgi:hypothetical protein